MKTIKLGNSGKFALVDDEDFERVSQFGWWLTTRKDKFHVRYYACGRVTKGSRKLTLMHKFILPDAGDLDHHDDNGLNNQRVNLRPCNDSQNQANRRKGEGTSKFKGVNRYGPNSRWSAVRWRASVKKDGVNYDLGYFKDEVDAATAYNFKAYELFGEYAKMNKPEVIL